MLSRMQKITNPEKNTKRTKKLKKRKNLHTHNTKTLPRRGKQNKEIANTNEIRMK